MTVVASTGVGGDDGGGNQNTNFRNFFGPAILTAAAGANQVRITVKFGTGETSEIPAIDDMYFGQSSTTAQTSAFAGDQIQIKFAGGSTINGSAAGVVTSDWVNLPQNWDNTKGYVCAWHVNSAATGSHLATAGLTTNYGMWFAVGATTSSQTNPAIASLDSAASWFVSTIEVQSSGGVADVLVGAMRRVQMKRKILGWTPLLGDNRRRILRPSRTLWKPSVRLAA